MSLDRRADNIRTTVPRFLWHGRLPRTHFTVVAGAPSKGKSTLGYLAAKESDVPTIFVTSEEADETVWKPRLEAVGMDLAKAFHHREVVFSKRPEDLDYLRSLVERYEAKLVVVDPLTSHMRGGGIHHNETVRSILDPYEVMGKDLDVTFLVEVHVLKEIRKNMHPLDAVPAGIGSFARAVYLLGDDPQIGADPNMRILACTDKFNLGQAPPSARFEFSTRDVRAFNEETGNWEYHAFGVWEPRGFTKVSAKTLLVTLSPESKERKSDRAANLLLQTLKDGSQLVGNIRLQVRDTDPPISWRTIERVKNEMGILEEDDPTDNRRKIWSLPPETLAAAQEADSLDELRIEEIEIPDAPPADWDEDDDA